VTALVFSAAGRTPAFSGDFQVIYRFRHAKPSWLP
jgi:hypothetical protein